MKIFYHHIYEYKKGLRDMVLFTTVKMNRDLVTSRLEKEDISYRISEVGKDKINVFFGDSRCIAVVNQIGDKSLSDYTAEEDFMLGTMLGYNKILQCERYLKFTKENKKDYNYKKAI